MDSLSRGVNACGVLVGKGSKLRKGYTKRLPQGQDAPGPGFKVRGILPESEDAPIHRSTLAMLGKEALTQQHFPSHALWKEFPLSAWRQSFRSRAVAIHQEKVMDQPPPSLLTAAPQKRARQGTSTVTQSQGGTQRVRNPSSDVYGYPRNSEIPQWEHTVGMCLWGGSPAQLLSPPLISPGCG